MADLSMIDIEVVVYALRSGSTRLKQTALTRGGNKCGVCPNPKCSSRKDSFYILPEATDSTGARRGKWACRKCHEKEGDAIELLRFMEGLTDAGAFARLKEIYPELDTRGRAPEHLDASKKQYHIRPLIENAIAPAAQWQTRARQILEAAQARLWDEAGADARQYLYSRGITDETLRAAGLGYIPTKADGADIEDSAALWGLTDRETITLYSGIIFPYEYKGELWKLRARRIGEVEKEKRYRLIPGSSNGMYGADTLRANHPAIVVEGEIDALSMRQELGPDIAVVALGSTGHARIPLWIMRLSLASWVFLCMDNDTEPSKTEGAASYWLKRLDNARVLEYPQGYHDANDMLQRGADIAMWVVEAIDTYELGLGPERETEQNRAKQSILEVDSSPCFDSTSERTPVQKAKESKEKQSIPEGAPFASYEHFVSHVQAMASALTERTGVTWTTAPLAPGQTLQGYLAQEAEAERIAAREKQRQLFQAKLNRAHKRAS